VIHAKLPAEVGAIVKKAIEEALALVEEDARQDEPKAASEGSEARSTEPAEPNANQTQSNVPAETIPPPIPEASEATHERRDLLDTLGAKRADGLRLLAETFLARQSESCGSVADRFQVVVHIDQRRLASPPAGRSPAESTASAEATGATESMGLAQSTESAAGPRDDQTLDAFTSERCELDDGRGLALATVRRLACDASLVGIVEGDDGAPLNVGRKTRSIPPALQRALNARDGGCRFHHRLIHEGGFGLHVVDDGAERDRFVFTRPNGSRVEANGAERCCGSGASGGTPADHCGRAAGDAGGDTEPLRLLGLNREAGLAIDWQTSRCRWLGERMDYGLAVQALVQRRDSAAAPIRPD
jgi:hypothetical protein